MQCSPVMIAHFTRTISDFMLCGVCGAGAPARFQTWLLLTRMLAVFVDEKVVAPQKTSHGSCESDLDCRQHHFCAIKCYTGACGSRGEVSKGKDGKFCQPCKKCNNQRSWTKNCDVCKPAGKTEAYAFAHWIEFAVLTLARYISLQFCVVIEHAYSPGAWGK